MKKYAVIGLIVLAGGLGIWVNQQRNASDRQPVSQGVGETQTIAIPTPAAPPEPDAADPVEPVETLVDEAVGAAADAVDQLRGAATGAVEEAVGAATGIVESLNGAAGNALSGVVEGAESAAGDAALQTGDADVSGADATGDAVDATTDDAATVEGDGDATGDGAPAEEVPVDEAAPIEENSGDATDIAQLFTPEGFDHEAALSAIDAMDVSTLAKTGARSALEAVRDRPELLPQTLNTVRGLLGIE